MATLACVECPARRPSVYFVYVYGRAACFLNLVFQVVCGSIFLATWLDSRVGFPPRVFPPEQLSEQPWEHPARWGHSAASKGGLEDPGGTQRLSFDFCLIL